MKLLVDARYTRIGFHDGISRYTASLLKALYELQQNNDSLTHDVQLAMIISDERQLPMLSELPYIKICSPTSILEPLAAVMINKYAPDVVFSPMQTIGSWRRKFGLILTLHDLIYYSHPTPPSFLPRPIQWGWRIFHTSYTPQRILLNRADAVVTVSETTRRLITKHRLTRRPLTVVPNAAPVQETTSSLAPASQPSKDLLYMGAFLPYKNVELLIKMAELLPEYTLHLLSKIDPRRLHELQKISGDNVTFHNGISDDKYRKFLAYSTALLTASRDEGYGLPVVEAMAAGCPVVISDISIFHEIAPGAAHCSPDDAQAFAQAVRELEKPGARVQAQLQGYEDEALFDWHHSAKTLLKVANQVHQKKSR